jgi:isocitrate/isopropylmalate dehydrogenase
MMLRHSLREVDAADAIGEALKRTLDEGLFTADIAPSGHPPIRTAAMGDAIVARL